MSDNRLAQAIALRQFNEFEQATAILNELLAENPNHPSANYEMAWMCDLDGDEIEAVPYYERAIAGGLEGDDLRGALLGLGSTYRTIGRYDDAVKTLRRGIEAFPDAGEFPVFLAMALYNTGDHAEAMRHLLKSIAETTSDNGIKIYKNAILFYHDKLEETWQ